MILETHTWVLYFSNTQAYAGGALSDILYFLVVSLAEIFCSSQAAANFGD